MKINFFLSLFFIIILSKSLLFFFVSLRALSSSIIWLSALRHRLWFFNRLWSLYFFSWLSSYLFIWRSFSWWFDWSLVFILWLFGLILRIILLIYIYLSGFDRTGSLLFQLSIIKLLICELLVCFAGTFLVLSGLFFQFHSVDISSVLKCNWLNIRNILFTFIIKLFEFVQIHLWFLFGIIKIWSIII